MIKRICTTTLALVIAVTLVAPSVYSGLLPNVHAQTTTKIGEVTLDAAVSAATGYAACNLGGWVQGFLAGILPDWLAPTVTATESIANEALTTAASGAAAASASGAAAAATAVGTAYTTSLPTSVPTNNAAQAAADASLIAQLGTANAALGAIAKSSQTNSKATISTSNSTGAVTFKKCVLDPLMWTIRDVFLQMITNDIIEWIEGGFEGTPAFLEDPEDFLTGLADTVLNDFLYDSGLDNILCKPFQLDVIFGISFEYNRKTSGKFGHLSCSLDEIFPGATVSVKTETGTKTVTTPTTDNAHSIMTEKGSVWGYGLGLAGANSLAESNNNVMGSTMKTTDVATKKIGTQSASNTWKLDMGKSWFSLKCDKDDDFIKDGTCTPGEFIAGSINDYTGSALEELTIADEFSEILNALFSALVKELLEQTGMDGDGLLNWTRTD